MTKYWSRINALIWEFWTCGFGSQRNSVISTLDCSWFHVRTQFISKIPLRSISFQEQPETILSCLLDKRDSQKLLYNQSDLLQFYELIGTVSCVSISDAMADFKVYNRAISHHSTAFEDELISKWGYRLKYESRELNSPPRLYSIIFKFRLLPSIANSWNKKREWSSISWKRPRLQAFRSEVYPKNVESDPQKWGKPNKS